MDSNFFLLTCVNKKLRDSTGLQYFMYMQRFGAKNNQPFYMKTVTLRHLIR
jgi:hypothetical protein